MDVKEEHILGDSVGEHWYYRAKGQALLQMLGGVPVESVVDVGAGSGYFSRLLLNAGRSDSSFCVDPAYDQEIDDRVNGRPLRFRRVPPDEPAALTLMMDVIEHVDDDVALVRQYSSKMAPGGHMLVTVPAFNWLWSGHDEFLEHRRRYTRQGLERVLDAAGLEVLKSRYFFAVLLPLVVPLRLWDRLGVKAGRHEPKSSLSRHPRWVNATLATILALEQRLLFPLNGMAGLTVFCLARKTVKAGKRTVRPS